MIEKRQEVFDVNERVAAVYRMRTNQIACLGVDVNKADVLDLTKKGAA